MKNGKIELTLSKYREDGSQIRIVIDGKIKEMEGHDAELAGLLFLSEIRINYLGDIRAHFNIK